MVRPNRVICIGLMLLIILLLAGCDSGIGTSSTDSSVGLTPHPESHTFTVSWQLSNSQGTSIAVTPKIPPAQLNAYPSSYVNVTARFHGMVVLNADDPYYQCFEAMSIAAGTILIFEAEPLDNAVAGTLFLVAYSKCGPLLQTQTLRTGSSLAMLHVPNIHYDESDYVVLYEFTGTPAVSGACDGTDGTVIFPGDQCKPHLR